MDLLDVVVYHEYGFGQLESVHDNGDWGVFVRFNGLAVDPVELDELEEPYELRTADEKGKVRVVERCMVGVVFQGAEVPGGAVFEVAENLRRGIELTIGRPEIDRWDIVFTPEGVRPRKVPIEFEII